jgi:DNA-binding GntR family transcriptional regulator
MSGHRFEVYPIRFSFQTIRPLSNFSMKNDLKDLEKMINSPLRSWKKADDISKCRVYTYYQEVLAQQAADAAVLRCFCIFAPHCAPSVRLYNKKETNDMPTSAAEKVRARLERDILTFAIKPGEKLDETKLAETHGVSRTPVREALRQLSASGLVEMRPHRGAVARRLSLAEIVELFEMMAVIEGVCTRLAAKRATVDLFQSIRDAHEKCREYAAAGDMEKYYTANEEFHEALYRACGNTAICRHAFALRDRLQPFRRYQLQGVNRLQQSFAEHEEILAAIEQGDAARADELIQQHLAVQSSFIANLVMNMPREFIDEGHTEIVKKRSGAHLAGETSPSVEAALAYVK